jgi:hypothetical protein
MSAVNEKMARASDDRDLRLAAADLHRGLVQKLKGEFTALSALASHVQRDAARTADAEFVEHAGRSAALVARLVDMLDLFLEGPFGNGERAAVAAVNPCLRAVLQFLKSDGRWIGEHKTIAILPLPGDSLVACPPLALTSGLRHLVEYFLLRLPPWTETLLMAELAPAISERMERSHLVLNRSALRLDRPYVSFRIVGSLKEETLGELSDAFSSELTDARTGNLRIVAEIASAAQGAILLTELAMGVFAVELLVSLAA